METSTRNKKSKEERIAILDRKIATHKANIETLEAKKDSILNPKPRKNKVTIKKIILAAKEHGLTETDIAARLGIKVN